MPGARRDRAAALALLGLTTAATPAQITGAYRRLAQATHPDRCADADAGERFAALTDAYRSALGSASPPAAPPRRGGTPAAPTTSGSGRSAPRPTPRWIAEPSGPPEGADIVVGPAHFVPWSRVQDSDTGEA